MASSDTNVLAKDFPFLNFNVSTPDMFSNPEDQILHQGPVWHGAAIAWHDDINDRVTRVESDYEQYSAIRINLGEQNLLAISVYAPTSGKDEEFLECFSHLSNFVTKNKSANDLVVLGLDSNCSEKSSSRRKSAFAGFCKTLSLRMHKSLKPTFHHSNLTSESCIDFFLVSESESLKPGHIQQVCTLDNPLNLSSHDPLVCNLKVQQSLSEKSNKTDYTNTYREFDETRIIWDSTLVPHYQELAGKALSGALEFWDQVEAIPLLCSLFSQLLVKTAKMTFQSTPLKKKSNGLKKSRKLLECEKALKKAHKAWKIQGKPRASTNQSRASFLKARAELQKVNRMEQRMTSTRDNNYLMQADIFDKNRVFARMKSIRREKPRKPTKLVTPTGIYLGDNILEGFAADSEYLGRAVGECEEFDNNFYRLCILDNMYIFDFKGDDQIQIPEMSRESFLEIINQKMKLGKACDAYTLTVEHIRECGEVAQECIRKLINLIIKNIYYLTCSQVKVGLGSCIFKGKKKPVELSNSYRRVTVTPQLGGILDRYINPVARNQFRKLQNKSQYGFTEGVSYLLASVERGECQRWALDHKLTCYGISLDGEAAFPSVEREILVRELYATGERGDYLRYSNNTYKNTECHIKMDGKISRSFKEWQGTRQGHVRADNHYKAYINPCLEDVNRADLGFHIGHICVGATCCADDTYLLSGTPSGLQSSLDIVSHCATKYRVVFNPSKTKAVITGSKHDMSFYQDTQPWVLHGERIKVVVDNEHLGLVVSGLQEEQKNIDKKISLCRNSLYSLLGSTYAYKCKLSPVLQSHLWRTYNLPCLVSGLAALPIRPSVMSPLTSFHHKILRGFLRLSRSSPIPCLYFLLGELPLENKLHLETLTLFHNIWSAPSTKLFEIVKYVLMMSDLSSQTWANHVRLLSMKYNLPDPLALLNTPPCPKPEWKELLSTKITVHAEKLWRAKAAANSKMKYLNVNLLGLSGRPHPALLGITSAREIPKLRIHLKFLSGDFLTFQRLAKDRNMSDTYCRLCQATCEDIQHVLTECKATEEIRQRLLPDLLNMVMKINPVSKLLDLTTLTPHTLTQFVLDCGSPNLSNDYRISYSHPDICNLYQLSRDWCFSISNARTRLLKQQKS